MLAIPAFQKRYRRKCAGVLGGGRGRQGKALGAQRFAWVTWVGELEVALHAPPAGQELDDGHPGVEEVLRAPFHRAPPVQDGQEGRAQRLHLLLPGQRPLRGTGREGGGGVRVGGTWLRCWPGAIAG
jgi:hypothetical protein